MSTNRWIHPFTAPRHDMIEEILYEDIRITRGVELNRKMVDEATNNYIDRQVHDLTSDRAYRSNRNHKSTSTTQKISKLTDPDNPENTMLYFEQAVITTQVQPEMDVRESVDYTYRVMVYRELETGRIVFAPLIPHGDMGWTLEPNTRPSQVYNSFTPAFGIRPRTIVKEHLGSYKTSLSYVHSSLRKHYCGTSAFETALENTPCPDHPNTTIDREVRSEMLRQRERWFKLRSIYWTMLTTAENNQIVDMMPALFIGPKNLKELASRVVGEQNLRSDVLRTFGNANLQQIGAVACLWREGMPVDWAVRFLQMLQDHDKKLLSISELPYGALAQYQEHLERSGRRRNRGGDVVPEGMEDIMKRLPQSGRELHDTSSIGTHLVTLAPVLECLDEKSVRRLLMRRLSYADVVAIVDAANLVEAQTDPRFFTLLHEAIPHCDNWRDLEYRINAHSARCTDLRNQGKQQLRQEREDRRMLWLQSPEGQQWNARVEAQVEKRVLRETARAEEEAISAQERIAQLREEREQQARRARTLRASMGKVLGAAEDILKDLSDEFTHTIAKDQQTLVQWGAAMRNCIAGYTADPINTRTLLIGTYDGHELVATSEVQLDLDQNHSLSARLIQLECRTTEEMELDIEYEIQDMISQLGKLSLTPNSIQDATEEEPVTGDAEVDPVGALL